MLTPIAASQMSIESTGPQNMSKKVAFIDTNAIPVDRIDTFP